MISQATIDEVRDCNRSYYKIYLNRDNKLCVVEMQWFDEYDYESSKFYKDDDGYDVQFESEYEARKFLNDTFKVEYIAEDDLTPNHPDFKKLMRYA